MMPGIRHYSLGMIFLSGFYRKLISPFLHHDTYDGCNQGYNARLLESLAADGTIGLGNTRITDHHTHHEERNADDGSSQGLILTMSIVMVLILRLVTQLDKHQHHHIGGKIGKRMDGVRNHCRRMSEDSCRKLQHEQHHIDDASRYRHLIWGSIWKIEHENYLSLLKATEDGHDHTEKEKDSMLDAFIWSL